MNRGDLVQWTTSIGMPETITGVVVDVYYWDIPTIADYVKVFWFNDHRTTVWKVCNLERVDEKRN